MDDNAIFNLIIDCDIFLRYSWTFLTILLYPGYWFFIRRRRVIAKVFAELFHVENTWAGTLVTFLFFCAVSFTLLPTKLRRWVCARPIMFKAERMTSEHINYLPRNPMWSPLQLSFLNCHYHCMQLYIYI